MKQKNRSALFVLTIMLIAISIVGLACKPAETSTDKIKKFSSVWEMRDFLKSAYADRTAYGMQTYYRGIRAESFSVTKSAADTSAPQATAVSDTSGASDYSTTNIQVAGVDEADFIKNDNKYIYVISGSSLVIVDAFPAENAKILSKTALEGQASELFINKDRLIVFVSASDQENVLSEYDYMPRPQYITKTKAIVYDISDRASPKVVKSYSIKGNYYDSRMIGDYVYFIVQDYVNYYNYLVDAPTIKEKYHAVTPEVYYFDNPEDNYVFNVVASFNVQGVQDEVTAKTFLLGYSNTLYVSQDNIYITYQKNLPYKAYAESSQERFYNVVVPLLPLDIQAQITTVKSDSSLSSAEQWDKISVVMEEMYAKMDESAKKELIDKIEKAIADYEAKLEAERRKTIIHKISISNGEIEYKARGEVNGYLLNQFSMDESGDYFRVATTTYVYRQGSTMYNNVYVLDDSLKVVGKLEDIAPDERIYSARFIGNRLYMVTFKNIDPLFVIDLSEPTNPKVLGELKIPGFSNYLHPYDENHIIGIGKETDANEFGGVTVKGLKLALFDVANVNSPKQLSKYEIGERGTDSEALYEHKAFLFDKKKNLLVIPVGEVKARIYDSVYGYYKNDYWQGAYVFGLTPETGFQLKGKITHNEKDSSNYYNWQASVRRSLFMDDVLYTVSNQKIMMNDLDDIRKELNKVALPTE